MSFVKSQKKNWIPLIASLVLILVIGTVAAIVAFTQTSPTTTIPAPPPPPALTPLCSTLANFTTPTAATGSVAYSCTGQPSAFTATNGPVTSIPTVHGLATGLTLTFYSGVQNLNPCPGSAPSATIVNNTSMNIANGNYNYCVFYTGLTIGVTFSFSVNWK